MIQNVYSVIKALPQQSTSRHKRGLIPSDSNCSIIKALPQQSSSCRKQGLIPSDWNYYFKKALPQHSTSCYKQNLNPSTSNCSVIKVLPQQLTSLHKWGLNPSDWNYCLIKAAVDFSPQTRFNSICVNISFISLPIQRPPFKTVASIGRIANLVLLIVTVWFRFWFSPQPQILRTKIIRAKVS